MTLLQIGSVVILVVGVLYIFGGAFIDEVRERSFRSAIQGLFAMVAVIGSVVPMWFLMDAVFNNWGEWPLILLGWPIYFVSLGLSGAVYWFIFGVFWTRDESSD